MEHGEDSGYHVLVATCGVFDEIQGLVLAQVGHHVAMGELHAFGQTGGTTGVG